MVDSGNSKWLLLVSDQQGDAAVGFDEIIGMTPPQLMKARGAGGVYDSVRLGSHTRAACRGSCMHDAHAQVNANLHANHSADTAAALV